MRHNLLLKLTGLAVAASLALAAPPRVDAQGVLDRLKRAAEQAQKAAEAKKAADARRAAQEEARKKAAEEAARKAEEQKQKTPPARGQAPAQPEAPAAPAANQPASSPQDTAPQVVVPAAGDDKASTPQQPAAQPAATSDACPAPPAGFGAKDATPASIEGKIYFLDKNTRKLPDFTGMQSQGSIYTTTWNVPRRGFKEGFPGVTDRYEWFAIDYQGSIYVSDAGLYVFRLASDDGAILYIDGQVVVDVDGLHPYGGRFGRVNLSQGDHTFRLSYFQGPAYQLGLELLVTPPDAYRAKIFNLQDFSKTVQDVRDQLTISENDNEIRATLGAEVLFDFGKYDLRPASTETLGRLATLLRSYPGLPILIEGHTDNVGRPDPNQVLSENRADAVKMWLVASGGVPVGCITTKGYGLTRPVATNDTDEGRQKNRRVEVTLQKVNPGAASPVNR
jgi:outer membrane protein OmpA-like peptidoglycan-associated protein